MSNKKKFREELKKIRDSLTVLERKEKSLVITERLIEFIVNSKSNILLSYSHIKSEVETKFLNRFILNQKLSLNLPLVEENGLSFRQVFLLEDDLAEGSFGVHEPKKSLPEALYNKADLVIVPGLAFDLSGNRLGYGKGYYDNFLKQHNSLIKIGLAFQCQLMKKVPVDENDIAMDYIITEEKFYEI